MRSDCLCVCNQWAFADNCADAVDRLLICQGAELLYLLYVKQVSVYVTQCKVNKSTDDDTLVLYSW